MFSSRRRSAAVVGIGLASLALTLTGGPGHGRAALAAPSGGSHYRPLVPARILDTRTGRRPLGPGESVSLPVAGVGGVPAAGVSAVAISLSVTDTSAAGWIAAFPDGTPFPGTASLNWAAGETRPNLVVVPVGTGGAIRLLNCCGQADVVVDVQGFFSTGTDTAGLYRGLVPARVMDTRTGLGGTGTLGAQQAANLQAAGAGNVPATGVVAVAMNVAVTNPTTAGWLLVYPAGMARPAASNVNYSPGETIPNRVIAKLGQGGQVTIFNCCGRADVVVDVTGYFTDGSDANATGGEYFPVAPVRVMDTRTGLGGTAGPVGPGATAALAIAGAQGVPPGAGSALLNVAATDVGAPGWISVYPSGDWLPLSSDLNFVGGATVPNLVLDRLGADGRLTFYNCCNTGADVVADLMGWFTAAPTTGSLPGQVSLSAQAGPAGTGSVHLEWTAAAGNGSTVTSYTVRTSPPGFQNATGATSMDLAGLTPGQTYSFQVAASNAAGTAPASNAVSVALPRPLSRTLNVPYYAQQHTLSCEAASLRMALAFTGRNVDENSLLAAMNPDGAPGAFDAYGNLHWSDPYVHFVGSPDGHEYNYTGYGAYHPVVAQVAGSQGAGVAFAGEGFTPEMVYNTVLDGRPVVVWLAFSGAGGYTPGNPGVLYADDGRAVMFGGGYEHAAVVVGVTPTQVLVNNPWATAGPTWLDRSTFEASYAAFDDMAVVLA